MKSVLKEILNTSIYLLSVLLVTYLVITFVGQRTVVNGSSMEATLQHGDNLKKSQIGLLFSFLKFLKYSRKLIVFKLYHTKNN